MVAQKYIEKGIKVNKVVRMVGLPRSSYYYSPKEGKPGKKTTEFVLNRDGRAVPLSEMVKDIESL